MSPPPRSDSLFPSGSIGRTQSPMPRMASMESLSAHPLLSPTPSTAASSTTAEQGNSTTGPRYVPYTPRQRVTTTTTTTSTNVQPSVSVPAQQNPGDARSKLQLMSLKAATQKIGLDTGSVGWAILEKLAGESEHGAEWTPVWDAIITSKATLLLPTEPVHSHENITADFVKDHLLLCDGSSREDANVVTLSGLRGRLSGEALTFRSSLAHASKPFQALLSPASRSTALSGLPPLPSLPATTSAPYPSFNVPSYATALPLPPKPLSAAKPPLPARPSIRGSPLQTPSRLPNPFSFFSKQNTASPPAATALAPPAEPEHVIDVAAFTVDRRIVFKDVSKGLIKALRAEEKELLASVPTWVSERAQGFMAGLHPLLKAPRGSPQSQGSHLMNPAYVVNPLDDAAEDISRDFQDFYAALEDDLHTGGSPVVKRGHENGEEEKEKKAKGRVDSEARIREILEVVERTVCSLLYDRLFSPASSDDASHDEALSSRVAAMNLVDLGLEHLGVEVGRAEQDVEAVTRACGEMLSTLSACRSPADKSAILVAAHKVVTDGLSRLPPIRLKSEDEIARQETPKSASFDHNLPDEDDEVSKPSAINTSTAANATIAAAPIAASELVLSPAEDLAPVPPVVVSPFEADQPLSPVSPPTDLPSPTSPLEPNPGSPLLTVSPPPEKHSTPVSGDILLPVIIFSVVKSNPPRLVSELLYAQRYRNQSFGGEESYCLVNLMAVVEFLENVDLKSIGLGDSEKKIMSTADLAPLPLNATALGSPPPAIGARLRGRMEQQVDLLTGSANKVFSGVVDSSFGVLRSFLPSGVDAAAAPAQVSPTESQSAAPWNGVRPAFGLLRRESGFSIASLVPGGRDRSRSVHTNHPAIEEGGQQMIEVSSRPGSRHSVYAPPSDESDDAQGSEEEEDGSEDEDGQVDARSIRSFESMMGNRKKAISRKSLSDRLASMPGLGRLAQSQTAETLKASPPSSRRSSLLVHDVRRPSSPGRLHLQPQTSILADSPTASRDSSPGPSRPRLAPPNPRFLECTEDDLKMSEIRELLREYKRIVEGARAMGVFDE